VTWRAQFVLLAAIWGSSFLFIKVLDEEWPPVWIAFGRIGLGALTLVVLTVIRGERLSFDARTWGRLTITGAIQNSIPFTLFALGETHVSSIVAGLWNATTPLWVLIIVLAVVPEEAVSRERMLGLAIGFAGVLVVLGPWRVAGGQLIGHFECAGAALCYGLGWPYTRRHLAGRPESAVVLSAGQLVCATALMVPVILLANHAPGGAGLKQVGSLLALGALGSGVAYLLNYTVIRAAGAAVASTVTYIVPIVATLLGVVVLGEGLSWNLPVGAAIMLTGIALSQGRIQHPVPRGSGSPSKL
jgi:drug/metabolite transporter (DMT)-like permease